MLVPCKAIFKFYSSRFYYLICCRDESFTNKNRYNNMASILHNSHLDEFVTATELEKRVQHVIRAPAAELLVVEPTTVATVQKMK